MCMWVHSICAFETAFLDIVSRGIDTGISALYRYGKNKINRFVSRYYPQSSEISSPTFPLISFTESSTLPSNEGLDYSVNFMWINKEYNPSQLYIYPGNKEEVQTKLINQLTRWAAVTTDKVKAKIVLWYDSQMTSESAISNTWTLLQHSLRYGMAPIEFQNVRNLDIVKNHLDLFSSQMKVYWRVDLLRMSTTLETLNNTKQKDFYFVYCDLDALNTLSKEELFNPEIRGYLEKYGIVLFGCSFIENSFHIVSNNHPYIKEALQYSVIDYSIERGEIVLKAMRNGWVTTHRGDLVWQAYENMLVYLKHLMGLGKLMIDGEIYSKEKHGLKPFGVRLGEPTYLPAKLVPLSAENPVTCIIRFPSIQGGDY